MKKFALLLSVLLISAQASAMHAYRSEDCSNDKFTLSYTGNYPFGGYYKFDSVQNPTGLDVLDFYAIFKDDVHESEYSEDEFKSAAVVYEYIHSQVTSKGPTTNDGCFDHNEWESKTVIKIRNLSSEAKKLLNLSEGDILEMSCKESTDIPNPIDC